MSLLLGLWRLLATLVLGFILSTLSGVWSGVCVTLRAASDQTITLAEQDEADRARGAPFWKWASRVPGLKVERRGG